MTNPNAENRAGINGASVIHMPIKSELVNLYLGNVTVVGRFEPHRIQGFVGRGEDTAGLSTAQLAQAWGLTKIPGWGTTSEIHYLKFYASNTFPFRTSYGGNTRESSADMGVHRVYPPPFLGTGYFPGGMPIPEYVVSLIELPFGAELWVSEKDQERRLGVYKGRTYGWDRDKSTPAFGPADWFWPPQPIVTRVRRGFTARRRGQDFDADLAGPGKFALYPMPGQPAPADFVDHAGSKAKVVDHVELDDVTFVRTLCQWRGATFEILARTDEAVLLHLVQEDYLIAQELPLMEVDYRVWRGFARPEDVTDVRVDVRPVPAEGVHAAG